MKRLTLLFLSLLMLCGCNNNKNTCTSFKIDNTEYRWKIDYEDQGKLIIYNVKNGQVKYEVELEHYKIVYDDNVSSITSILYCYNESNYLLVVGI